jgi:hypothetical protein
MKVLLRYIPQDDEDEELETSLSMTLPKGWLSGPTSKLKHLFVDQFNKKHPDALVMDKEDCRLETKDKIILNDEDAIDSCVSEGAELYLRRGRERSAIQGGVKKEPSTATPSPTTSPNVVVVGGKASDTTCKRFGCGKRFIPGQPASEPCKHHKKPPVFHETRKYWACCPDKVAWDWESFQAIEGCEVLPEHTNVSENSSKKVMGGTELRAELNGGPKEIVAERKVTGLDKLMNLRQALVTVGVDGAVFDGARDSIKRVHEDVEGKNVWDKVCVELSGVFESSLKTAMSGNHHSQ